MKHPEILLIPVLMMADYYLTILGSILYSQGYGKHIRLEHYELNPAWQTSVRKKVWFNPRHLLLVFLTTVVLFLVSEFAYLISFWIADWFLGALIMVFSALVGRHLTNVLMFQYVRKNPTLISGESWMKHALVLKFSQYQFFAMLIPLGIITMLIPSPFLFGCVTGLLLLVLIHAGWAGKHRKSMDMDS